MVCPDGKQIGRPPAGEGRGSETDPGKGSLPTPRASTRSGRPCPDRRDSVPPPGTLRAPLDCDASGAPSHLSKRGSPTRYPLRNRAPGCIFSPHRPENAVALLQNYRDEAIETRWRKGCLMSSASQDQSWRQVRHGKWSPPQALPSPPPPQGVSTSTEPTSGMQPPSIDASPCKRGLAHRPLLWVLLVIVVFFGGCSGSISGVGTAVRNEDAAAHTRLFRHGFRHLDGYQHHV